MHIKKWKNYITSCWEVFRYFRSRPEKWFFLVNFRRLYLGEIKSDCENKNYYVRLSIISMLWIEKIEIIIFEKDIWLRKFRGGFLDFDLWWSAKIISWWHQPRREVSDFFSFFIKNTNTIYISSVFAENLFGPEWISVK